MSRWNGLEHGQHYAADNMYFSVLICTVQHVLKLSIINFSQDANTMFKGQYPTEPLKISQCETGIKFTFTYHLNHFISIERSVRHEIIRVC